MWKTIYLCEDSTEGVFTAVYDAWANRKNQGVQELYVGRTDGQNFELFVEYITVVPDEVKTEKVLRSVRTKLSADLEYKLLRAALSDASDRAQVIYEVLQLSFAKRRDCSEELSIPCVCRLMEILRNYGNEEHLMLGFLRFQSVADHSWLAVMEPKNNILPGLMAHFARRFQTESFMIVDKGRGVAGVYRRSSPSDPSWWLVELDTQDRAYVENTLAKRDNFEELWGVFFNSISIDERENYVTQRNHCPLWYRKYMLEFQLDSSSSRS